MFDEEYPDLMPAPPAPRVGILAGEAGYTTWEGRLKAILTARRCSAYDQGFNDKNTIDAVERWERSLLEDVAKSWYFGGFTEEGSLKSVTEWLDSTLAPWAKETKLRLEEYRRWKISCNTSVPDILPSLGRVGDCPPLFAKVLSLLRQINKSGEWPSTTPGRQLVMKSTCSEQQKVTPLSVALLQPKRPASSPGRRRTHSSKAKAVPPGPLASARCPPFGASPSTTNCSKS